MSLFVRVNTNFYAHRKTAKLRAKLGNDALWLPPRIWAYAAENQPDGNFSSYTADEIAALISYTGDAKRMLQALLEAGFFDRNPLRIHDWQEYNAYHVTYSQRATKAAQARWQKRKEPKERDREERRGEETSIASSMLQASPAPANSSGPSPHEPATQHLPLRGGKQPALFPNEALKIRGELLTRISEIKSRATCEYRDDEGKLIPEAKEELRKIEIRLAECDEVISGTPGITLSTAAKKKNRGSGI